MKYMLMPLVCCMTACARIQVCEPNDKITTGVVQREVYIGMPASDVATILGSPNIVSLDENKNEVWVYDKVCSEVADTTKGSGVWLLLIGGHSQSSYSRKSQRTLTVIIKFDNNKLVKDFTYHSSSF